MWYDCTTINYVTWWSCGPPWNWASLFFVCEWESSCVSGGELGYQHQSGLHFPSPWFKRTTTAATKWKLIQWLREELVKEKEVLPGVILSDVGWPSLVGSSVPGARSRRWMSAAQWAAAISEVWFAVRIIFLFARRVGAASQRCWGAPVVSLHPIGAVMTLEGVATFWPAAVGKKAKKGWEMFDRRIISKIFKSVKQSY